jgi:hypothetical protein
LQKWKWLSVNGEGLRMQEPKFYRDAIFELCQEGTNASMCSGIMVKNKDASVE